MDGIIQFPVLKRNIKYPGSQLQYQKNNLMIYDDDDDDDDDEVIPKRQ